MTPKRAALLGLVVTSVCFWGAAAAAVDESEPADSDLAQPSALASETLLLDAAVAGERIVAVGHFGHVLLSDDGGGNWRQAQRVPTRVTLTEVFFVDDSQGWAVGHDAVILHTDNAGESWKLQHRDRSEEVPLLSVWFEDTQNGWAVGAFGMLLETTDGGQHWARRSIGEEGDELHLNHLFPGPEGLLFIAAEAGSVYRSADRGLSWERLQPPYPGSFWNGLTLPDGAVLVIGMRGHAFLSPDLGESWQPITTGTDQSLSDLIVLRDGDVVAVGLGGTVLRSDDGGHGFTAATERDRKNIASVAEGAGGSLLLFGEAGVRRRTISD
jgi:photosystem II stability/assembly factor-like uncharacterized protein